MKYYARSNILQPAYMKKFSCIGSRCEDNCCNGKIAIDQEAYRAIQAGPDSEIKHDFLRLAVMEKGEGRMFASLAGTNEGKCPLLNDNGLCRIHAGLGEEYLSCVCYTVPKRVNRIGADFEISLKLFCPEACRAVLLEESVMEFDSLAADLSAKNQVLTDIPRKKAEEIQPAWFGIRSAFIDMLQDRRFGVGHRLVLAGLAAERLEAMNRAGASGAQLLAFLNGMARDYASDAAAAELASFGSAETAITAKLLKAACVLLKTYKHGDETYLGYINKALSYFGTLPAESSGRGIPADRIDAYFSSRQYILENWLVNMVFGRCFPLRNQQSIFAEYTRFVLYYYLLKAALAGIAGAGGELDDALLVDFLHRFSMPIEMEPGFEAAIDNFIRLNAMADMRVIIGMAL